MGAKFNKAFWKWFGDSKVVDKHGDPLVVYHGTREKFDQFRRVDDADFGFHFGSLDQAETRLERTAKHYRGKPGRILSVFLSIQNPLRTKDAINWGNAYAVWKVVDRATKGALGEFDFTNLDETAGENGLMLIGSDLRNLGYDGIVYKNGVEGDGDSWIAFRASQIKSAKDNDGTWDSGDSNMRSNPYDRVEFLPYLDTGMKGLLLRDGDRYRFVAWKVSSMGGPHHDSVYRDYFDDLELKAAAEFNGRTKTVTISAMDETREGAVKIASKIIPDVVWDNVNSDDDFLLAYGSSRSGGWGDKAEIVRVRQMKAKLGLDIRQNPRR